MSEEALKALRKRLRDDFAFYAEKAPLKIKTKKGITTLKLKEPQLKLVELIESELAKKDRARIIILKARQLGLSTATGGYLYYKVSQNYAKKALVVTQESETTKALFQMTKRFHDNIRDWIKPHTKYASQRELSFDLLDSGYVVATAGGENIGRGHTFNYAHLSELAFWPKGSAEDNFNALMQAVPSSDGSIVVIESTANGVTNLFYREWQKAVAGESDFIPLFIPWHEEQTYSQPCPEPLEHTPAEATLVEQFGVSDEQLMFRRMKIAEVGEDMFKQEYPSTPEEAFLTSGAPVFPPEHLAKQQARDPEVIYSVDAQGFHENQRGSFAVWHEPEPGEDYYVSADSSSGSQSKGKDWSVSHVLDSDGKVVARYRAQVQPDVFAMHLEQIGQRYNEAKIIVEANNHGGTVLNELYKHLDYTNVYMDTYLDKTTEEETTRLGFNTNKKSKIQIIDKLKKALREQKINIPDKNTLDELRTFVEKPDGGMGAEGKNHDDCVMSLALALHIHERRWTPIVNQESWYVEGL